MSNFFKRIKAYIPTAVYFLVVVGLTVPPVSVGPEMPPLFEGFDKLVHFGLFGVLAASIIADYQNSQPGEPQRYARVTIIAIIISIVAGIAIEYIQDITNLGRCEETADKVADVLGAIICPIIYVAVTRQNFR